MSLLQAILIGIMSCTAASTIACLGTTVGNYTLNRPLVAALFVGLILGDVKGCIEIGIPMQVMWIALVTPGGTVASDLRAVSYIGLPLAYVGAKSAGMDFAGEEAQNALWTWLADNSYKYGFIIRYPENKVTYTGISNEPWHLRYVGVDAATEMKLNDQCLEEYLLFR